MTGIPERASTICIEDLIKLKYSPYKVIIEKGEVIEMSSEGNTLSWISNSRYGALRTFDYLEDTGIVHVRCEDVQYISYSMGVHNKSDPVQELESIDPDGGPYLKVGGLLYKENTAFRILRIVSYHYNNKKKVLEIVLLARKEDIQKQKKEEKGE